jgi:hypothetical protein
VVEGEGGEVDVVEEKRRSMMTRGMCLRMFKPESNYMLGAWEHAPPNETFVQVRFWDAYLTQASPNSDEQRALPCGLQHLREAKIDHQTATIVDLI